MSGGDDVVVFATCACIMPCAAGINIFRAVDIFNVRAGTWSTAALSEARYGLAATSLPDAGVAIFAGGTCIRLLMGCLVCCGMGIGVRGMRE